MLRAAALAAIVSLAHANISLAEPMLLHPNQPDGPNYDSLCTGDALHCEIVQLVHNQTTCFKKEALSKSIAKTDLETAAYAVLGRCVVHTQRLKGFQAGHDIRNPQQMEQYWAEQEKSDLQGIKQMIAIVRTQR